MTRLTTEQRLLKQRILASHKKGVGSLYFNSAWEKNLWKKPQKYISGYLRDAMINTEDEVEYYQCMSFLLHLVPDAELLVEWEDSPNRHLMTASYEDFDEEPYDTHKHTIDKTINVLSATAATCTELPRVQQSLTHLKTGF